MSEALGHRESDSHPLSWCSPSAESFLVIVETLSSEGLRGKTQPFPHPEGVPVARSCLTLLLAGTKTFPLWGPQFSHLQKRWHLPGGPRAMNSILGHSEKSAEAGGSRMITMFFWFFHIARTGLEKVPASSLDSVTRDRSEQSGLHGGVDQWGKSDWQPHAPHPHTCSAPCFSLPLLPDPGSLGSA